MKDGIHPKYHEITVEMTDGTTFSTRSTYGEPGAVLKLEIDSKSHPAWIGGAHQVRQAGRVARFNERFGNFRAKGSKS